MQTQFKKSALASNLLAAMAISCNAGSAGAADTIAQNNLEARQEAQIQTTYNLSPYLRAIDLKVSVHGDKATLSGKVNENAGKELAEQIALGANGIKSVDNQIVVDPEYVPPMLTSPVRKYGEIVDDASITAAVKSKLLWSKYTDDLNTNVDTNRGRVILTGTADNKEAKAFAGQLARSTNGVKSVDNRLEIKPKAASDTSNGTIHKTSEAISDTWITTKVKSTFMYSSDVNSSDISVTTSEGIVTLSGNLDSLAERNMAIELAQNLRGVKKVNAEGLTVN
jgi:osmotically-inducible protein OsmY